MEKQNSSTGRKVKIVNPVYWEIFEQLKPGSQKILKGLRKSRGAKLCYEIQEAREKLKAARDLFLKSPEPKHMKHLVKTIQIVINELKYTKKYFHSKKLWQTRESAIALLEKVNEIIKKYKSGVMPMEK
jgi:hypothetical protein